MDYSGQSLPGAGGGRRALSSTYASGQLSPGAGVRRFPFKHGSRSSTLGIFAPPSVVNVIVARAPWKILVCSAIPEATRWRPLTHRLSDSGCIVDILNEDNLAASPCSVTYDAVLVLWSKFFHGARTSQLASLCENVQRSGALVLNDMKMLEDMQDRRWTLRKLKEHGVPTPQFAECSRDLQNHEEVIEEHEEYILISGVRVNKPLLEKPVDRRDREVYLYLPKSAGGGRALLSNLGCCRFDPAGRVRREGSFIYQEYLQSEGFMIQAVCVGGHTYGNILRSTSNRDATMPEEEPSPVWLNREEKMIAAKLGIHLGQTIFSIELLRSQTASGVFSSYVIDVWGGFPRSGLGVHCDAVVNGLLGTLNDRLSRHKCDDDDAFSVLPTRKLSASWDFGGAEGNWSRQSSGSALEQILDEDDSAADLLCVIIVSRHGDRTPKQKVKAQVTLESDFAAGWLCGSLAGSVSKPSSKFDLRMPEQLMRLDQTFTDLAADGHDVRAIIDALACIRSHGSPFSASVKCKKNELTVALKWGGELTEAGAEAAEAFGRFMHEQTFPGEDAGQFHATIRQDMKIYSSKEARVQHTAAAFCRGLMCLNLPAQLILATLVRTDEYGLNDSKALSKRPDEDEIEEDTQSADSIFAPASEDTPWSELETVICAPRAADCLIPFGAPGTAIRALISLLEDLRSSFDGDFAAPLYLGETPLLLRQRYTDIVDGLGPSKSPNFGNTNKVLDHLLYDFQENFSAVPVASRSVLEEALGVCEALCDVIVPCEIQKKRCSQAQTGTDDGDPARPMLRRLRWDLRVASGIDLGSEDTHLERHAALYRQESPAVIAPRTSLLPGHLCSPRSSLKQPCVRTRLYFGHNSGVEALFSALLGCRDPEASVRRVPRLGFLANVVIRLSRKRSDGSFWVACEVARDGSPGSQARLFSKSLAAVDEEWSNLIEQPS